MSSRWRQVSWRLWFAVALAAVAVALFVLVPDGGSIALLVLFGGLMALHHMPGGHRHGQTPETQRPASSDSESSLKETTHPDHGDLAAARHKKREGSRGHSGRCH